ncbi:MAG: ornithine carbamoyltransferase [Stygiobacter sp. RIFOXYA12_FULL_38_9]|nr:MAG: ornithine carbamoyltransferase [Stygiobacter sp. GWC2_38_9]OGU81120.1 MAG: ornithine carbamoyltransferase [Stygiobacter sp. RIFOXYA12_FULL_38_9]OGV08047.1 MAG: ornithine carbamoyltransferase [Stygiobacter sp. RIFOXYB2_FULL_37_11]OGV13077.1 MAG: ornithine carbamoyltransferase [Stygiobacter sp. RIFOXYA2_FULL_38_8]OGV15280.1 MAG: ornithine carbamoyltransferase [Stygiobacter sp. RIFOXYC2_FULL_38_25]OGV79018.1 MAG: ornithine carbamoyltransferase [Stygiobacter sp. GWF2_38_21]RJQ64320.1 MAG:
MAVNMRGKSLIEIHHLSLEEIYQIFDLSAELKQDRLIGRKHHVLEGKKLGMIFSKPSTRTRVSFEVGIYELGGTGLYFNQNDLQLKKSESVSDTAKVLSRYLDGIMIRTFDHQDVIDLAKHGSIPVINGLTDLHHPCQVLCDLFTVLEKRRTLRGLKLAYIGDGNNMAHSLLHGCSKVGMDIAIASPSGYMPADFVVKESQENAKYMGSKIEILEDPIAAVKDADIIYTDVWASMGQEKEAADRKKKFMKYQVNPELVKNAKEDYLFMHCLPAHRGDEVVDEVCDSPNSVIFDEAENRLHVQKAVMALVM